MTGLAEFLRARLDDDERLAQAGAVEGDLTIDFEPSDGGDQKHPGEEALLAHIGNWDPVRVLAEVETKRRIIKLHASTETLAKPKCTQCDWQRWPCPTLRLLTLPYADHPDYDPAWAAAEVSG